WVNFSDCRKSLLLFLSLVVSFRPSFAQVPPDQTGSVKKSQPAQPKLTATQERGLRLLKAAEGEAAGLAPDRRACVLWRASYAYAPGRPKQAESLTKDFLTASETTEDP